MLFVWLALWIIAGIILLSDPSRVSTRFASATTFLGGCGGLAVVLDYDIAPYFKPLHNELVNKCLQFASNFSSSISYYITPVTFLIFAVLFTQAFKWWKKRYTMICFLPVLAMYYFYPIYPIQIINFSVLRVWASLYIITGIILLLYDYIVEKNPALKKNKFIVNIAFIPPITFTSLTTYYNSFGGWQLNTWIIGISTIVTVTYLFKQGFMGVKLRLEKYQLDGAMKVVTSSAMIINHAYKNDLGIMKLFSEKINDYAIRSNQTELEEDVKVLLDSYKHMIELANRIQEHTQDIVLVEAVHNLPETIDQMLFLLKSQMQNIRIEKNYDQNLYMKFDKAQIEEVFKNILLNSIEAMPQGGMMHIKLMELEKVFMIEIKDSGVGISSEDLNHVFEPFFSSKQKNSGNFGLGLSYCYNVMKKSGGSLDIVSSIGTGTSVYVSFPKRSWVQANRKEMAV